MQKYLKKLCEDKNKKFVSEINKSCNFDRLNSPHNYPVHRYYKHDFDSDKRSICESSLASLKLNTSFFKEVKFTEWFLNVLLTSFHELHQSTTIH